MFIEVMYVPKSESFTACSPANMNRWPNVGLLLGQRRRRWANSKTTLGQRLMFASCTHSPNAGLMMGRYRKQWTNIDQTLGQSRVFPGIIYGHCKPAIHSHNALIYCFVKIQWAYKKPSIIIYISNVTVLWKMFSFIKRQMYFHSLEVVGHDSETQLKVYEIGFLPADWVARFVKTMFNEWHWFVQK